MALSVNRDTLELLGSMMPHRCGPSRPAASIVVVHNQGCQILLVQGNEQDSPDRRNQATLNIQVAPAFPH